ncbi:glycerophosphodiester phosphodiesterase [Streptomyces sp. SPB162]|uniref:glycerophosphodiester phosphodiesterase n=1 Tax=Streptomyces sp. SPB162 TaxID=2940560 RepID=UPI0024073818|nr:glycerophosphodiester phosphodiesterase [Streptomyces sp. SPB162]MDF9812177.1 glycerophosphoryl diester phosphodiesterase [Streptomyces sp. SPB162]
MTHDQQGSGPGRRAVLGAAAALGAGGAVFALPGVAEAAGTSAGRGGHHSYKLPVPTVIGHRGASGYRPEHTLGSYQHALDLGADVIEQDVVPTKDGHLVCRHEPEIGGTTDVSKHPEFASRRTTKTIDGTTTTGWFTEDFTLAELKTLRAVERLPANRQRNTLYDGRWEIPTFEEVLRWAEEQGRKRGRPVWLHSETKHPTYFRKLGLGLEERLAGLLRRYGRDRRDSPQFLESFESSSLQRLGSLGVGAPKIFLLSDLTSRPYDFVEAGDPRTVADLVTPDGLRWIARFARGIGPTLLLVIPLDATGRLGTPTTLVRDAHAAGLILHPYTMRNENTFLPVDFRKGTDPNAYGDSFGAFTTYFEQGIDGIFSDNADTALLAREDFLKNR